MLLTACSGGDLGLDPRTLPFRFEVVREFPHSTIAVDLDGDGQDEFVWVRTFNAPPRWPNEPRRDAVVLQTHRGEAIDQLNYVGQVLPPHFLDVTGDTLPEILVPLLRNDSLFLSIADGRGRKLQSFLLTTGRPRIEPDGVLPWDPTIQAFYAVDITGDGNLELITVIATAFARAPRGVLVHDLRDGRLLGQALVGAALLAHSPPTGSVLADFDGDGTPEIIIASVSTNNGAAAGGFDDRHAYLIVFRLVPEVEVAWSRLMGELGSWTHVAHADFDGSGRKELLVLRTSSRREDSRLEVIEPGSWRTLRQRSFPENAFGLALLDLSGDALPEIVVSTTAGEVLVLDGELNLLRRRRIDTGYFNLESVPDIDGDGIGEIVVSLRAGLAVLGPDLQVKALAEGLTLPGMGARVARPGIGAAPYLLGARGEALYVLRLVPNPFAWFWRWGLRVLLSLGIGAVLALLAGLIAARRSAQLQRLVQTLAVDAAPHGLLFLTRGGRVRWVNATLRRWIGGVEVRRWRGMPLEEVLAGAPEVLAFCRQALATQPPRHLEAEGRFRLGGEPRELRLVAEPVLGRLQGGPNWLVRFEDRTGEVELREARGWALIAEGVAHDFHKPLSGIGQEIDRMRRAYHRLAPETGETLDAYADDIKGRIVTLLQKTDELRQVLGGGEPRLEQMPLNEFVHCAGEELRRTLPEDIGLDLRAAEDAPVVRLDRRLMQSVLKNLVSNAVDAMREGGTITVSTGLVRGARIISEAAPRDYARLEVSDTGVGIPAELRERIWEPGFTTHRETGWGLGLPSVRRVVEAHRGAIRVESEPGVGAAFAVYLPAADGNGRAAEEEAL
jgi:signal transduction histidine kinase